MKKLKNPLSILLSILTIIATVSAATPVFAAAIVMTAPEAYYENGMVCINGADSLAEDEHFECKIGENGTWTVCSEYFSVVATQATTAHIRLADSEGNFGTETVVSVPRTIGLFEENFADIALGANALEFEFARSYNSDTGWFFAFESNVSAYVSTAYKVTDIYGNDEYYTLSEVDGTYKALSGNTLELIKDDEANLTGYSVHYDDTEYRYDASGKLLYTEYLTNKTTFTWSDSSLTITDVAGNQYIVYLNSDGNPTSITTPVYSYTDSNGNTVSQNRNVSYIWSGNNLISFVDSTGIGHSYGYINGKLASYDYYTLSYTTDGRLLSKSYMDGSFTQYAYFDSFENSQENQVGQIGAMTVTDSTGESYSYRYNGESLDDTITDASSTYSFVGYILNLNHEEVEAEEQPLYEDTGANYVFYSYDEATGNITATVTVNYKDVTDVDSLTYEQALAIAESKNEYVYDSNGRETNKLIYSKKDGALTLTNREYKTYYDDGRLKWFYYDKNCGSYWWSLKRYVYTYDAYGNIKTEYTYNPYDLIEVETNTTNTYNVFGELVSANTTGDLSSQSTTALSYTYDAKGRLIKETEQTSASYAGYYDYINTIGSDNYVKNTENSYIYDGFGNTTMENINGDATVYIYNGHNKLTRKYNPDGTFVEYTYDATGNLATKTFSDYIAEYSTSGELTKATKNGIVLYEKSTNETNDTETYANGQAVSYIYDDNERLTSVKLGDDTIYSYAYPTTTDEEGNVTDEWTEVTDNQSLRNTVYKDDITSVYDISGETPVLLYSIESESEEVGVTSSFNGVTEIINGVTYTTKYEDDTTTFINSSGGVVSRVVEEMPDGYYQFTNIRIADNYYEQYTIDSYDRLCAVETIFNGGNRKYANVYDLDGRIIKMNQSAATVWVAEDCIEYVYDDNDQLIRVNDPYNNFTRTYSYDSRGNITERKEYAYTTGSLDGVTATDSDSYTYSSTVWNDELTAYDGHSITYDAAGNPTSYMGHNLTWIFGRRLASFDGIAFTYNEDGIRTSKTVNGVKTNIYIDGTRIIHQTDGTNTFHFRYDSDGSPVGFVYNNADYFYIKNLQGDIMGILDSTYTLVAEYSYDEWGKVIAVTGTNTTLGNLNPLRYRGYYYDTETGLYYLQSRYYDPETGRFINADDFNYVGLFDTSVSFNAFAYCSNNPINDSDLSGHISLNSVKNFFTNIISTLTKNINNYLQKQFSIKNEVMSISTNAIAIIINTIISRFCAGKIVNASSSVLSFVLNRYKAKTPQKVVDIFTYIINGLNNKGVIRTIAKIIATKLVVRNTIVKENTITAIAKDLLSGILIGNNQLLKKVNTICSAVSSIGGFLAFIISGLDKNWFDGYLRINISAFKRRFL